jgi:hypothetical protein
MNKLTIADVLTRVDTLHQHFDSLHQAVMHRIDTFEEAVTARFDKVDRTLDEHSVALLELSTVTAEHSVLHRDHSLALGRIERRQRAETRALDDHERRIRDLEKRPYPSAPAS